MARRGPLVRVFNGKFANVNGTEATQKLIARVPDAIAGPIQRALDVSADEFVALYKTVAPVAPEFEAHPGQMRDSAHVEQNGRALSVSVVVDAKDEEGKPYPAHVEYGHKTKDGSHVPAKPAFWPVYQRLKRKVRSRVARASSQGMKTLQP